MLKKLTIRGLRGFAEAQTLECACPENNAEGSGLTIIVGANNAGKSTIVEALRAFNTATRATFTQGKRNIKAGDKVDIELDFDDGYCAYLRSIMSGSSQIEIDPESKQNKKRDTFILPSRRAFNPYFSQHKSNRSSYVINTQFPATRTTELSNFSSRLFEALENQQKFNLVLEKVLSPLPDWTIDQMDTGQYYLKIKSGDSSHSSDGLGEGLVSLFIIIDALYDSKPGSIIVIDEPELSLHPSLQRKLSDLFTEYSKDRQIIITTHSPYFINLKALKEGASIARVHLKNNSSCISQLSRSSAKSISNLLKDSNNPHVWGLNAQEIFFREDKIVLVEGQEDVIFFEKVLAQIGTNLEGNFFGWGVGGADKMDKIASILKDLDFNRVVGILDNDKSHLIKKLSSEFPEFRFFTIPADDVRTKKERKATSEKNGLLDSTQSIRPEYKQETIKLFSEANKYLIS